MITMLYPQFLSMVECPQSLLDGQYGPLNQEQQESVEIIRQKSQEAMGLMDYVCGSNRNGRKKIAFDVLVHDLNGALLLVINNATILRSGVLGPLNREQKRALLKMAELGCQLREMVMVVFEAQSCPTVGSRA